MSTHIAEASTNRRDAIGARIVSVGTKVLTVIVVIIAGYLGFGGLESYCVIWPSIDTRYAPDFSERKFAQVQVGMTQAEVVKIIGQPLGKHGWSRSHPAYKEFGDEVWSYTSDGAAPWGDWAWLSREIIFREGRVVQKVFWTYYD